MQKLIIKKLARIEHIKQLSKGFHEFISLYQQGNEVVFTDYAEYVSVFDMTMTGRKAKTVRISVEVGNGGLLELYYIERSPPKYFMQRASSSGRILYEEGFVRFIRYRS